MTSDFENWVRRQREMGAPNNLELLYQRDPERFSLLKVQGIEPPKHYSLGEDFQVPEFSEVEMKYPREKERFSLSQEAGTEAPKDYSLGVDINSLNDIGTKSSIEAPTEATKISGTNADIAKAGINSAANFITLYLDAMRKREALNRELGREDETLKSKIRHDINTTKSGSDNRSLGYLISSMREAMVRK